MGFPGHAMGDCAMVGSPTGALAALGSLVGEFSLGPMGTECPEPIRCNWVPFSDSIHLLLL